MRMRMMMITRMMIMMITRMIRIITKNLRIIIRVNIIRTITITMKTMRTSKLIMRMIKAMTVTGVNIIITIKLWIVRIARVITIIIRIRISAMPIEKNDYDKYNDDDDITIVIKMRRE